MIENEKAIRALVKTAVESYSQGFETRHIAEYDNPDGTINMKIHNVFIAALGPEIQYYTALVRSLDSSLGNMLEKLAINIAQLFYTVSQQVTGSLYQEQTAFIATLLEKYKTHTKKPETVREFWNFICKSDNGYEIVHDELFLNLTRVCDTPYENGIESLFLSNFDNDSNINEW